MVELLQRAMTRDESLYRAVASTPASALDEPLGRLSGAANTANDLSSGTSNILARVAYNLVGIAVAAFVVVHPFPLIMRRLNPRPTVVG